MNTYKHSVSLDSEKCLGCTSCLKHCPTEAIRIRKGKAYIIEDRCIDCGECIRICPHKAKKPIYSKLEKIFDYKWKIAIPAPALYGQFVGLEDVDHVLSGLIDLGFDDVFEVASAAELVSAYTRRYLKLEDVKKPVISSACPVIVRLIGLRFPTLRDHIMPMLPPMEIAARLAKEKALKEHKDLSAEDIGICFISPCPAKVSYVNNGFADYKSQVDLVVSMSDIYFSLLNVMDPQSVPRQLSSSGKIGVSWATTGGEASAIFNDKYLAADGIDNVIHVLDMIETGDMPQVEFIELCACPGGCVGGVMAVENPYLAKARIQTLRKFMPVAQNSVPADDEFIPDSYFFEDMPTYNPLSRLSDNIVESMRMMAAIQKVKDSLPGIDCGSCGAPNCRALAEDIIRDKAKKSDCIIRMRKECLEYLEKLDEAENDDSE